MKWHADIMQFIERKHVPCRLQPGEERPRNAVCKESFRRRSSEAVRGAALFRNQRSATRSMLVVGEAFHAPKMSQHSWRRYVGPFQTAFTAARRQTAISYQPARRTEEQEREEQTQRQRQLRFHAFNVHILPNARRRRPPTRDHAQNYTTGEFSHQRKCAMLTKQHAVC